MSQPPPAAPSRGDRPITWKDAAVYGHGALVAASLHHQLGWPMDTAMTVGMTGPVLWAMLRRR
ncbi:hypothetical protein [Streptomyces sp. NRRL WC-3742]|uniref:hypothetical protein n=1 Tax=Streptomyces sp. NRRL WC-3742 TaxID=1463934 RepID=UPI000AEF730C|nr:hypothetical protein [Streptomyces sp. NRRL WC-3742]